MNSIALCAGSMPARGLKRLENATYSGNLDVSHLHAAKTVFHLNQAILVATNLLANLIRKVQLRYKWSAKFQGLIATVILNSFTAVSQ